MHIVRKTGNSNFHILSYTIKLLYSYKFLHKLKHVIVFGYHPPMNSALSLDVGVPPGSPLANVQTQNIFINKKTH